MTGYKVIAGLHDSGTHPVFKMARAVVGMEYVGAAALESARLEAALKGAPDATIMAFVNQSSFPGLSPMHSITLIDDGKLMHFDASIGSLVPSARSLHALGGIGEALLFTGLRSVMKSA
jgi:hypothetical protein